jgi:hypothetical protein
MSRKILILFSLVIFVTSGFAQIQKGFESQQTNAKVPFITTISSTGINVPTRTSSADNINAIWTESFNTLALPSGWLNLQESGSGLWTFLASGTYPTTTPHSGAGMASFASYSYSNGCIATLVSSSFSLTAGSAKFGVWMVRDAGYATNADLVDFMINTAPNSTGATLLGTINRSKTLTPVEGGPDGWYYYEFIIPASFNTATNYIIMKATSQFGNNMYVDDASVSLLPTNDVGSYSIDVTSPTGNFAQTPKATVKNYGSAVQTFPVTMTITPGSYTSTKTVTSLTSGTTNQVTFDSWTPTPGTYTVKTITNLGTDLNRTNDTLVKTVVVQNAVSGSWNPIAPLSVGMGGVGVYYIAESNKIFLAGGSPSATVTNCYLYDPLTNTYTAKASLPVGRAYGKVVRVKNALYYVASIGTTFASPDGAIYKYDFTADTWTAKAVSPTLCQEGAVVVWRDSLIITIGGSTNGFSAPINTVMVYNTFTDTWTTLAGTVPSAGMGYQGECVGNEIVIVGGVTTGPAITNVAYRGTIVPGNPISISWRPFTSPYGDATYRASTCVKDGIIYFGPSQKSSSPPTGKLFGFKVADSTVMNCLPDLAPPLGNITGLPMRVTTDSTFIYTFGGYDGSVVTANSYVYKFKNTVSGISTENPTIPSAYSISQNYPNPFNPVTKISYALPKSGLVTIRVFDILGREISTLVNDVKLAGTYSVDFNAANLSSGMYFYKIETNGFTDIKKMMLIK